MYFKYCYTFMVRLAISRVNIHIINDKNQVFLISMYTNGWNINNIIYMEETVRV